MNRSAAIMLLVAGIGVSIFGGYVWGVSDKFEHTKNSYDGLVKSQEELIYTLSERIIYLEGE